MDAKDSKFLDFLSSDLPLAVPIFQRTYAWEVKHCERFWSDILRVGRRNDVGFHFIGSVVYVKPPERISGYEQGLVIDGQQRLTTTLLLLEALARHIGQSEIVSGMDAAAIRRFTRVRPRSSGPAMDRLELTKGDKESLEAVLQGLPWPKETSRRVRENFEFFQEKLHQIEDLTTLWKGLERLVLVEISLEADSDNPQLIFESMNSAGRALSQADLIRNFVLMGVGAERQRQLYLRYWRPMEELFGQDRYDTHFDSFVRHFLTKEEGRLVRKSDVYEAYKEYAQSKFEDEQTVDELLADLLRDARYYVQLAFDYEFGTSSRKNSRLAFDLALKYLRDTKMEVAYPLVLRLFDDLDQGSLTENDFISCLSLIESYLVRRAICGAESQGLNQAFARIAANIDSQAHFQSLDAEFARLRGSAEFPDDRKFRESLIRTDLYNNRMQNLILSRLENHNSKEPVPAWEFETEHILPQNHNLHADWIAMLGPDWAEVQSRYVHTLGNLTKTGANQSLGDRPFLQKRDMRYGFRESRFRLSSSVKDLDVWNEEEILRRANMLAEEAMEIWPSPKFIEEETSVVAGSSGFEHQNFLPERHQGFLKSTQAQREIFFALHEAILALSPAINPHAYADCYTYRAKQIVVAVRIINKGIRIHLNIYKDDLYDPLNVAQAHEHTSQPANRKSISLLRSTDEIPYMLTLIQQALERVVESWR